MWIIWISVCGNPCFLRPRFPGCDDACSGPCYRPLKHGLFVVGFSFLDGLPGLLVAVAVVPGRDPSLGLLLQFVPQCEEGGVEFDATFERVWDSADVGYRVPLLRRVTVCTCGPLIFCRHWSRLRVPSDVPSDEVIAIAIRSTHFPQMCLLGPFGVLCATMRIDSVKKGSKTTHFVSYRMVVS